MEGGFADAVGTSGHVSDGSEAAAGEEVTAGRGQDDGERNEPPHRDAEALEQFAFRMERGKNDQLVGILRGEKSACVATHATAMTGKRTKGPDGSCGECGETGLKNFRRDFGIGLGMCGWIG